MDDDRDDFTGRNLDYYSETLRHPPLTAFRQTNVKLFFVDNDNDKDSTAGSGWRTGSVENTIYEIVSGGAIIERTYEISPNDDDGEDEDEDDAPPSPPSECYEKVTSATTSVNTSKKESSRTVTKVVFEGVVDSVGMEMDRSEKGESGPVENASWSVSRVEKRLESKGYYFVEPKPEADLGSGQKKVRSGSFR